MTAPYKSRRQLSRAVREAAAELAYNRPHPNHISNGEELVYRRDKRERSYIASFTKGLPHCEKTGLLLNPPDYRQFIRGIQSGETDDFLRTPLGPARRPLQAGCLSRPRISCETSNDKHGSSGKCPRYLAWKSTIAKNRRGSDGYLAADVRAWESQSAGNIPDLEGPDAQAVTMPPAPTLGSDELAAEMAEVYLQALLRDTHLSNFTTAGREYSYVQKGDEPSITVKQALDMLKTIPWYKKYGCDLSEDEKKRHRTVPTLPEHLFRGITTGDDVGPYLSQFLLIGTNGYGDNDRTPADGYISYGAHRIDQRVRTATPHKDFMTTFESWLDVQNGADLRGMDAYVDGKERNAYRFITTPRDLATYVHHDQLYQAYLNAALILLGMKAPLDPGLPFMEVDIADHQQSFASFGGPHLLTLLTEVSTRALKAVRYQKFNLHRRARPEAIAGLIDRREKKIGETVLSDYLDNLVKVLNNSGILSAVRDHNANQNLADDRLEDASSTEPSLFLPMAYPEGSPMHPSYGAGHAAVAGACTTILKAFFDHGWELPLQDAQGNRIAYEANRTGSKLEAVNLLAGERLTVEGELNKLASNISIGRDWAGVHYFTDYIESLRMGEQIAIGILEEQRLTYPETFSMTIPLFDGGVVRI